MVTYQLTRFVVREVSGDMLTCYLLPGSMSLRPATACCCSDCVLLFYSLRLTVPSVNSAVRPPKETARTLSRIDLSRTCFHQTTNRPLLQTAYSPAYSAYSLLSATPSSATLAMPLLSTAFFNLFSRQIIWWIGGSGSFCLYSCPVIPVSYLDLERLSFCLS